MAKTSKAARATYERKHGPLSKEFNVVRTCSSECPRYCLEHLRAAQAFVHEERAYQEGDAGKIAMYTTMRRQRKLPSYADVLLSKGTRLPERPTPTDKRSPLQQVQDRAIAEGYPESICLHCKHFANDWCQVHDAKQFKYGVCVKWVGNGSGKQTQVQISIGL